MSNHHAVFTTCSCGQYPATLAKFPHTSYVCLLSKNKLWKHNHSQLDKTTDTGDKFALYHLPTIYEKQTSGSYLYTCTIHTMQQVSTSGKRLSNIQGVGNQLRNTWNYMYTTTLTCLHDVVIIYAQRELCFHSVLTVEDYTSKHISFKLTVLYK